MGHHNKPPSVYYVICSNAFYSTRLSGSGKPLRDVVDVVVVRPSSLEIFGTIVVIVMVANDFPFISLPTPLSLCLVVCCSSAGKFIISVSRAIIFMGKRRSSSTSLGGTETLINNQSKTLFITWKKERRKENCN